MTIDRGEWRDKTCCADLKLIGKRAGRGRIHTTHVLSLMGQQRHLRYLSEPPAFYENNLVVSPSLSDQPISDVSSVKPLVAFYDIQEK
jgi:hypothetical protein